MPSPRAPPPLLRQVNTYNDTKTLEHCSTWTWEQKIKPLASVTRNRTQLTSNHIPLITIFIRLSNAIQLIWQTLALGTQTTGSWFAHLVRYLRFRSNAFVHTPATISKHLIYRKRIFLLAEHCVKSQSTIHYRQLVSRTRKSHYDDYSTRQTAHKIRIPT